MLRADELVLQFRHFLLRRIEDAAQLIRETHIGCSAVDFWAAFQLCAQPVAQLVYIRAYLLEKRPGYALGLVEKRERKCSFVISG